MEWSIIIGIGIGLGLPGLMGLFFIVKMESRVTTLENARDEDTKWKSRIDLKLDSIARDVNRLIGSHEHGTKESDK